MKQSHTTTKQNILREMAAAIASGGWQETHALLGRVRAIVNPDERADVLNSLLVMPGHELHQEVAREIQKLRSSSSIPFIRHMLTEGFQMLEYTCSEPGVIAKWFSHALADINTPDAIALIKECSVSSNQEVAEEMAYRLERLNA